MECSGHSDVAFVWVKKGEALNPQNTVPIIKQRGASIMLRGCFSPSGPGNLVKIYGIMTKEQYNEIIEQDIKQSADKLQL